MSGEKETKVPSLKALCCLQVSLLIIEKCGTKKGYEKAIKKYYEPFDGSVARWLYGLYYFSLVNEKGKCEHCTNHMKKLLLN